MAYLRRILVTKLAVPAVSVMNFEVRSQLLVFPKTRSSVLVSAKVTEYFVAAVV